MDSVPVCLCQLNVPSSLCTISQVCHTHCVCLRHVSYRTYTKKSEPSANLEHRPWALGSWASFTFMGIEINRISNTPAPPNGHRHSRTHSLASYRRLSNASDTLELTTSLTHPDEDGALQLQLDPNATTTDAALSPPSTGELAGLYLGILNLFTTLPQFVGTFISTIVFAVLEPGKSPELAKEAHPDEHHPTDGPNAIAVCLFIGALASLVAAYATRRLKYVY